MTRKVSGEQLIKGDGDMVDRTSVRPSHTSVDAGEAATPVYDAIAERDCHRVSAIYAIDAPLALVKSAVSLLGQRVSDRLKLDRLTAAYQESAAQFPWVLGCWEADGIAFTYSNCSVSAARVWLFALPNDLLVLALTVESACDDAGIIGLLEDLHHRRLTVSQQPLWTWVIQQADEPLKNLLAEGSLSLETYNLLHLSDEYWETIRPNGEVNVQLVSSLIYRFDEPYSLLSPRIKIPAESNRGAAFAATGPYVGVSVRNQGYVENAIFISCILFVGALMTLRAVRNEAFLELQRARTHLAAKDDTSPRASRRQRAVLAATSQRLARLQLDLSCGVESFERMASTVPSLRVTDFHEGLFESARIEEETDTISSILDRITSALTAEADRRHAAERQADERKALVRAVATGIIATIALPLGIVFGFFGMSAREIQAARSFLDVGFYRVFYLALGGMLLVSALIAGVLYVKFRFEARIEKAQLAKALEVD